MLLLWAEWLRTLELLIKVVSLAWTECYFYSYPIHVLHRDLLGVAVKRSLREKGDLCDYVLCKASLLSSVFVWYCFHATSLTGRSKEELCSGLWVVWFFTGNLAQFLKRKLKSHFPMNKYNHLISKVFSWCVLKPLLNLDKVFFFLGILSSEICCCVLLHHCISWSCHSIKFSLQMSQIPYSEK